jgi:hypothetical protein
MKYDTLAGIPKAPHEVVCTDENATALRKLDAQVAKRHRAEIPGSMIGPVGTSLLEIAAGRLRGFDILLDLLIDVTNPIVDVRSIIVSSQTSLPVGNTSAMPAAIVEQALKIKDQIKQPPVEQPRSICVCSCVARA